MLIAKWHFLNITSSHMNLYKFIDLSILNVGDQNSCFLSKSVYIAL